jgi:hypothetical protein
MYWHKNRQEDQLNSTNKTIGLQPSDFQQRCQKHTLEKKASLTSGAGKTE